MRETSENSTAKPGMLFVHHGGEMYGSDKVFVQTVRCASLVVMPVVVLSSGGPLEEQLGPFASSISIFELGVLRRKGHSPIGILRTCWRVINAVVFLCLLIRRRNIQGVYTNTISILSSPIAALLMRVPHIWHVHEIIERPKYLSRFLSWIVPRLSIVIVCNSFATKKNLLRGLSTYEDRFSVIHNGIDCDRFKSRGLREHTRAALGVRRNQVFVGVIGRISHWKGQDVFLEAAAQLSSFARGLVFGIIGGVYGRDGEHILTDLLRFAKEKGIEDRVRFIEFQSDVSHIYEALDIVVVPSKSPEPFGLVSIEAMAAMRPVVATDQGGSLEIVDDRITGYLVPAGDSKTLGRMIYRLAKDARLRREMGKAARQRVEELFSEDRFQARILGVIKDTISVRGSER